MYHSSPKESENNASVHIFLGVRWGWGWNGRFIVGNPKVSNFRFTI